MQRPQPLNKDKIEKMCRAAGLAPQSRRKVGAYDLFLADGFSLAPHRPWQRFGIEPTEFAGGCYVTFWWLMKGEERLLIAGPIFFDINHNPEYIDATTRQRARINRAVKDAETFVKRLGRVQMENGRFGSLH